MNRLIVGVLAVAAVTLGACTGGSSSSTPSDSKQPGCGSACSSAAPSEPGSTTSEPSAQRRVTTAPDTGHGDTPANKPTDPAAGSAPGTPSHGPILHRGSTLIYHVTSDAEGLASISYVGNKGQVDLRKLQSSTWTKKISPSTVRYSVLIAIRDSTGSYIACSITQDGKVLVKNRSSGHAKGVNCQI